MSSWGRSVAVSIAVASLSLAAPLGGPSLAQAQSDIEQRRDEAKKLADRAFDLLSKGLNKEAIDLFVRADDSFHSPVFIVYIAEAQEKLGQLVQARARLQSVIDEKLAEYAPDSFREAQSQAKQRAEALDARIPKATIVTTGDGAASVTIELDGRALGADELGSAVGVNPGKHSVKAMVNGEVVDDKTFELAEGASETIELVVSGGPTPEPEPGGGDTGGEGGSEINWLYPGIAFGVGGAGLIMGIVTGALFLGKAGDLKDSCKNDGDGDDNNCSAEPSSEGDDVKLLGNLSTAGFVIAGVGIAAGIVLVFVPLGDEPTSAQLRVGPTGMSLSGRF
jgi:hypothetical protein